MRLVCNLRSARRVLDKGRQVFFDEAGRWSKGPHFVAHPACVHPGLIRCLFIGIAAQVEQEWCVQLVFRASPSMRLNCEMCLPIVVPDGLKVRTFIVDYFLAVAFGFTCQEGQLVRSPYYRMLR